MSIVVGQNDNFFPRLVLSFVCFYEHDALPAHAYVNLLETRQSNNNHTGSWRFKRANSPGAGSLKEE